MRGGLRRLFMRGLCVAAVVGGASTVASTAGADEATKLLGQMQQLGGKGDGADIMAQLEAELGGLLGKKPTGYVYVNQMGQRIEVPTREQVPRQFRDAAQPVYPGAPRPEPKRPAGPSDIYKYKDHEGREVYTNIVEQIPVEERAAARLDLSHVTLNSELGTEIQHRLAAAHGKLVDSEYCADVRANAKTRAYKEIWDEYAPLIICGVVLLIFVLGSPFMVRRVGGPAWSRVLMFALPALAFSGFIMYSMTSANRALVKFKRAQTQEESCTEGALASASGGGGPDVLGRQLDLIKGMQRNMQSHLNTIMEMDSSRNASNR